MTRFPTAESRGQLVEAPELDVLVVAAHPDDAEIGAGGAVVQLLESGRRVGVLDLTDGEPTPHGSRETRRRETDAATAALGLTWRANLGLPNRMLEATLPARRHLAEVIRQARPQGLLVPFWEDAHPDHVAACELAEGARFWAKLTKTDMAGEPHYPPVVLYYHAIHLKTVVRPSFVLDISAAWDRKIGAIRCYESQFLAGPVRKGGVLGRIETHAAFYGAQIGAAYGEPWTVRETLAIRHVAELFS